MRCSAPQATTSSYITPRRLKCIRFAPHDPLDEQPGTWFAFNMGPCAIRPRQQVEICLPSFGFCENAGQQSPSIRAGGRGFKVAQLPRWITTYCMRTHFWQQVAVARLLAEPSLPVCHSTSTGRARSCSNELKMQKGRMGATSQLRQRLRCTIPSAGAGRRDFQQPPEQIEKAKQQTDTSHDTNTYTPSMQTLLFLQWTEHTIHHPRPAAAAADHGGESHTLQPSVGNMVPPQCALTGQ